MQQEFKIVCIGCSYTQGLKLDVNDPYPKILYDLLKNSIPNLKVYNCGIGGSGAKIHKVVFEWVEETIKPDLIIYQITNDCRTQIIYNGDIKTGFDLDNEYENYYSIYIPKPSWVCLPVYAYLGTVLPKSIYSKKHRFFKSKDANENDQAIQDFYEKYIKQKSILTYEHFLSMCLYKNHYESPSPVNWLDYVSDIDYVHKYCKTKMLSFFWEKQTLDDYNNYMEHHQRSIFNGTSIEDVFINQNKNIDSYSIDKQRHLDTSGMTVVAEWIKENIK